MFYVSQKEHDKIDEWASKHDKSLAQGAIGGRYTFSFTFTNIGRILKVTDNCTGEVLDATYYEDW